MMKQFSKWLFVKCHKKELDTFKKHNKAVQAMVSCVLKRFNIEL